MFGEVKLGPLERGWFLQLALAGFIARSGWWLPVELGGRIRGDDADQVKEKVPGIRVWPANWRWGWAHMTNERCNQDMV